MNERNLPENLKLWMEERGLDQKNLAKMAGVNETYIRDILDGGSKNPTVFRLQRVAEVLNCTLDDLMGSADPTRRVMARSFYGLSKESQEEVLRYVNKLLRLETLEPGQFTKSG